MGYQGITLRTHGLNRKRFVVVFFSVKNLKLLWVFTLGLEIWPRLTHFPRLLGAETEALDQWFPTFFSVGAKFQILEYVWSRMKTLK